MPRDRKVGHKMTLTKFDFGIAVSMSIAIVLMSLIFPTLGLAGDKAKDTEIPEFNVTTDRFGGYLDQPVAPNQPSQGTLIRNDTDPKERFVNVHLDGDTNNGTEMTLFLDNNVSDPTARVTVVNWDSGSSTTDEVTMANVGDSVTFNNFSYTIQFEYVEIENKGESDVTLHVDYYIEEQPGDVVWLSRIPVVGNVIDTVSDVISQLVGVVGWIGAIFFYYLIEVIGSGILNAALTLYDLAVYFINLMHFLTVTYSGIINGSNSPFVQVMLAIPSILLSYVFAKLIISVIQLIPTT